MTESQFWQLIQNSRAGMSAHARDGNMERQRDALRDALAACAPDEILGFREQLWQRMTEAYSEPLWDAAYVTGHGCSTDGFDDFRAWLVSMGRDAFVNALADPESLEAVASAPEVEDVFFEGLLTLPDEVYEQQTHTRAPAVRRNEPKRRSPLPDQDTLRQRFPRLWARFQNDKK